MEDYSGVETFQSQQERNHFVQESDENIPKRQNIYMYKIRLEIF